MLAYAIPVGCHIDAIDSVGRDIRLDPLNARAEIVQDLDDLCAASFIRARSSEPTPGMSRSIDKSFHWEPPFELDGA